MTPRSRFSSLVVFCLFFLAFLLSFHLENSHAAAPPESEVPASAGSSAVLSDPVSTGAAAISIPIKVPPGRKGIAPNVSLTYSSGRGNGWVGVGWDLGLGAIQRSTKRGTNYASNDYVATINGSVSELVSRPDWGSNCYGLKIEKGFSRYYLNQSTRGWEVTAKGGTKYFYGTADASRQRTLDGRTFKWYLDKVEDVNGNYMTVTYFQDQGEFYPYRIDYTGKTGGVSPSNYVLFILETTNRTDVTWMFPGYIPVRTAKKLKEIQMFSNNSLAGKYVLDYVYSNNSQRSLLTQVTQYGSNGSALPPTTFAWQHDGHNWSLMDGEFLHFGIDEGYTSAYAYPMVVGDFNGDGKTDVGRVFNDGVHVYLSDGAGGWTAMPVLPHLGTNEGFANAGVFPMAIGDFNGDGRTDVGRVGNAGVYIYLSDGTGGWTAMPVLPHLGTNEGFANAGVYPMAIGDFNGDGRTDVGRVGNAGVHIYLSDGAGGWTAMNLLPDLGPSAGYANAYVYPMVIGDFNGDGRTDIGRAFDGVHVYLSDGAGGWTAMPMLPHLATGEGYSDANTYPLVIGDFNGDGKTDIGRVAGNGIHVYLSDGAGGWTAMPTLSHLGVNEGYANANTHPLAIGDFNGDGKTDVGRAGSAGVSIYLTDGAGGWTEAADISGWTTAQFPDNNTYPMTVGDFNGDGKMDIGRVCHDAMVFFLATPPFSDSITQMTNSAGGWTDISYTSSSAYQNTLMPFVLKTVSGISVDDDNGNVTTTRYDYAGGLFDFAAREFRGFAYQKVTGPIGTSKETWYAQDAVFNGLPSDEVVKDPAGDIYTGAHNTLDVKPYLNTSAVFPYIRQRDDYLYDGAATPKTVATVFEYDDYGNPTRKYSHGDIAVSGDEKDERVDYYPADTTAWVFQPSTTYVKDSAGITKAQTWFRYDTNGNLQEKEDWLSGGSNPIIAYHYDGYGNQDIVTDPRGNPSTTTYDSTTHTYPSTMTSPTLYKAFSPFTPYNLSSSAEYDYKYGKIHISTDVNSNPTTSTYDGFGRPKTITSPETNPAPAYAWKEIYYDGLGRTIKKRTGGPNGKVTVQRTFYNAAGQVAASSLPYFEGMESPAWTHYAYDPLGRVIEVTNPDGTTLSKSYMQGRTTIVDANGHKRVEERDVYGRLAKVEEYVNSGLYATTTYAYDVLGNLLSVTDAANNQTTMTYDTLSRKRTMHDPDMGNWSYSYDANGNLVSQTDAKSQTIHFHYDELNRIKDKQYPLNTNVAAYAYDFYEDGSSANSKGRLTTVTDTSGTEKSFYDALGSVWKTIKTIDGASYATETGYDALGRPASIKYPDMETVAYTYDSGGNLSGVTGYAAYWGFNALGQPAVVTYPNGADTILQYYPLNRRLYSITTNSNAAGGIQNLTYSYDNVGNITQIDDLLVASRSQSFQYDDLNRLTQAQSASYGGTGIITYQYNTIGNMTSNSQVGNYSYNTNGVRPHAATLAGTNSYAYDANGNMVTRGGVTIAYNYDNRPASVGSTSFVYDYSGQRVKKTGSSTVVYIGKHYECVNGVCKKYIFAGGQRIAMKQGSSVLYYHSDHLGSSSVVTDPNGNNAEEIYYYPYGGSRQDSGGANVRHKYTGQEFDDETGLYYYNARYYDPQLGRFISADSIAPAPANPQTLNRYSYVGNNPIIYTDPSGHCWWDACIVEGAIIGAVIGGVMSAVTGGNVLEGMLTGAISGAFFGGAGSIIESAGLEGVVAAKVGVHTAAGAISSGINVGISGGNVGLGALTGGIAGGLGAFAGGYLENLDYPTQVAGRSLVGGISGGITAEIYGGNFGEGFISGAKTAAIASVANDWLHFQLRALRNRQETDAFFDSFEGKAAKYLVGPLVKGITGTTLPTEMARETGTTSFWQGLKSLMRSDISGIRGFVTLGGATATVGSMAVNMVGSSIIGYYTFNGGLYVGSYIEAVPDLFR